MALTEDQKAMLRLLAQREQGYEDMAALMGLSVDEVRARVREALAELEKSEEAPSAPAAPPPPAKSQPRPAAVSPPAQPGPRPVSRAARPSLPRPQLSLPQGRPARIGLLAGAVAIVLVVVLFLSGVLGGDSDSGSGANGAGQAPGTAGSEPIPGIDAREAGRLTQAILTPPDGGEASGRALFGRDGKRVVLQVEAQGLDPSPRGQSYVVWLARSPEQMLPLAASKVEESGEIVARYQIATEVLAFLASGSFDEIRITLIADTAFRRSVARARKAQQPPAYTGEEVLRGKITGPIVGAAARSKR